MLEQKLPARQQRPVEVLDGLTFLLRFRAVEHFLEFLPLLRSWRAACAKKPGLVDDLRGFRIGGEETGNAAGFRGELVVHRGSVREVQRLDEAGLIGALALAGDLAGIAAEGFEEVVLYCRIPELQRSRLR